jgi:hypothetical protein
MGLKTFILGFSFADDKIIEYKTRQEADELAEDWCIVKAINLEQAIKNYEFPVSANPPQIVITAGTPFGQSGTTNLLRVVDL